ncbi:hypothetical protein GCM10010124_31580 [Pilimelia terevasa]|uniref:Uncharacterized protein n=1 Tax=Pilimelia terevasa TaxID=53372 RepID=A0A8J3BNZ4_9ACTN|nr:hypothetical protein [Pilimelia terevasa]GGK36600.1 hypothetical protein GCM10010124_31580 [Pilimelia terevasa]
MTTEQKVVHAMWTDLNRAATAAEIAAAAGLGYSTVTPILRRLHKRGDATKDASGRWALVEGRPVSTSGNLPEPDSDLTDQADEEDNAEDEDAQEPDTADNPTTTPDPDAEADTDEDAEDAADSEPEGEQTTAATAPADTTAPVAEDSPAAAPDDDQVAPPEPPEAAADGDGDGEDSKGDADPDEAGGRKRRSPAKPKRGKGVLREEVLAMLRANPDQAWKVSEICRLVNDADDGTHNIASPGAVANALEKLAGEGSVRQLDGKPVTFQAE